MRFSKNALKNTLPSSPSEFVYRMRDFLLSARIPVPDTARKSGINGAIFHICSFCA